MATINMKHIHYYIMSALAAMGVASCTGDIDYADRFIKTDGGVTPDTIVDTTKVRARMAVLIEDFTGQRCTNCPKAAEEIENLVAQYGDSLVIGVGIHSGTFGFAGNDRIVGFMTDTGNEYYNYWGIQSQPSGVVNRRPDQKGGGSFYTAWGTMTYNETSTLAPIALSVDNTYDEATRQLTIRTSAIGCTDKGSTKGKLQLWLTEDSIVALQSMPDGSYNYNYMHEHVFRDAVNGTWGEDISVAEGDTTLTTHTYTLKDNWVAKNVSVVAFVYNDAGVQQVVKRRVMR